MIQITPIEIIALLFAIGIIAKVLFLLVMDKKKLLNLVEKIMKRPCMFKILLLAIAGTLLYFLLQELTIIQIVASSLFGLTLAGLVALAYPEGYMKLAKEVVMDMKKGICVSIIFLALAIWVLITLF